MTLRDYEVVSLRVVVVDAAAAAKATFSKGGSDRLRFSARRRIPAAALWLKKYLSGTSCVSKTSDNEDTTTSLGHSEPLSVKQTVGEPIPHVPQRPEDGSQITPPPRRQKTADVFDETPPRADLAEDSLILEPETRARSIQTCTFSCDADVLAREASDDEVDSDEVFAMDVPHVFVARRAGKVLAEHLTAARIDFTLRFDREAFALEAEFNAPDAAEESERP